MQVIKPVIRPVVSGITIGVGRGGSNSKTYYVSNSGNDSLDGLTPATAWQTISKVNNSTFNPGERVLFNKGDVWREQLTVPSSGSVGRQITFGSYGTGANPIISGSNILTGWTSEVVSIPEIPGITANLADETFNAAGYDLGASWTEVLGTNCIADEDNTDIVDSSGGNSQILKLVKASTGWNARSYLRFQASPPPISYFQCYNNIASEGLASSEFIDMAWTSGTGGPPWAVRLLKTGTVLNYSLKIRNNGADEYYKSSDIALNTWYKIEVKWDLTNGSWEWKLDGIVQDDGLLTGTLYGNPEYFFLGDNQHNKSLTTYYDNVRISSLGYFTATIPGYDITVYKKLTDVKPNQVLLDYNRLVENTTSKVSITVNQFWWDEDNTLVYVRTAADDNISNYTAQVGYRLRVLDTGSKSYLTFDGITFEGCNSEYSNPAVSCAYNSSEYSVKFYNCTIQYNAGRGIRFSGGADNGCHGDLMYNCIIRYNWMDGIYSVHNGDVTIEKCRIYTNGLNPDIEGSGVYYKLGNYKIINCDIYDNGRRTGYAHGVYQFDTSTPVSISKCSIYSNPSGAGIRSSGSVILDKCKLYGNYAEGCDFSVPNTADITYQMSRNLIYDNIHCQIILAQGSTGTIDLTAFNNTIYNGASSVTSAILIMGKINNILLKNNIIHSANQMCLESRHTEDNITMISDNNNFFRADDGDKISWINVVKTFAQWQALGFDVNGLYGDPKLVNPITDFHLQSDSPCINAGVDVGLTEDYEGNPIVGIIDIGAYEYQP